MLHIDREDWVKTEDGSPRGYIQPEGLEELWFHTGTVCNLSCPFCFEGSKPGDYRLEPLSLDDMTSYVPEALELGVKQFNFTGGEPFVVNDMVRMLDYALDYRPCMVLTNGTEPVLNQLREIEPLNQKPFTAKFRISIDFPDPEMHDKARGKGNFHRSLLTIKRLHEMGFETSIARLRTQYENTEEVDEAYRPLLREVGAPDDINIVSFPDFLPPGYQNNEVPEITEECMTTHHTEETRRQFMCNYSKMIVKKNGRTRIYACTLVDDDEDFDLGGDLRESLKTTIMLKHHRCFSCFAHGACCSE